MFLSVFVLFPHQRYESRVDGEEEGVPFDGNPQRRRAVVAEKEVQGRAADDDLAAKKKRRGNGNGQDVARLHALKIFSTEHAVNKQFHCRNREGVIRGTYIGKKRMRLYKYYNE